MIPAATESDDDDSSDSSLADDMGEDTPTPRFRRVANQNGLEMGQERLWCDTCTAGFIAATGEQPPECPEGHAPTGTATWAVH